MCVIISADRVLKDGDDTAFDCGAGHARIPEDPVIMKAVALGWPDDSFPANALVFERKTVEEAAYFLGFEETV